MPLLVSLGLNLIRCSGQIQNKESDGPFSLFLLVLPLLLDGFLQIPLLPRRRKCRSFHRKDNEVLRFPRLVPGPKDKRKTDHPDGPESTLFLRQVAVSSQNEIRCKST